MKVIILAGGKGERLSPFTNNCPKGMLKIEGKPILEYQIEWLKKYNFTEIIFACGYLSEVIKNYFGDGSKFGVKISYSIENEPLGRGGAIKKAWALIQTNQTNEPILVLNGDIFTEMNLNQSLRIHKEQISILATVCLFPYKSPYGIVRLSKNGLVDSFEEKRTLPYWVNGGIYIFEHGVKKYLPDIGEHELTTFPELSNKGLLYGYKCLDYWKGIDTVKDLNEFSAEKRNLSLIRSAVGTLTLD